MLYILLVVLNHKYARCEMLPKKLSGAEIRALREKIFDRQGFSQKSFGRFFNVSARTVRRWESAGAPNNNRGAKLARLQILIGEPGRVVPTLGMGLSQFLNWQPTRLTGVRIIDLLNTDEGFRTLISPELVSPREIHALTAKCVMGNLFSFCQFCKHDGNCPLRHCDYMGAPPGDGVDPSGYPGHEDIAWHLSGFQSGSPRARCTGRIHPTGSLFLPLICECSTALNSGSCAKFRATTRGQQYLDLQDEIAQTLGIDSRAISWEDIVEAGLESGLEQLKDPRYFAFSRY